MSGDSSANVPLGLTTEGLLGRRYVARIVDSAIILLLISVVVLVLNVLGAVPRHMAEIPQLLISSLLVSFIWIGYGAALECSRWQATVGKKVLGLRVYNGDGGRLTPRQAVGRNFLKDGPFLFLSVLPGGRILALLLTGAHLWVVHSSARCQAIHDRLANTWVAAPEETIRLRLTQ